MGKRLRPLTKSRPKCLLVVNGKPIIEHQIDACRKIGLNDIVVITGYKSRLIRRKLGNTVRYAHNSDYRTTQTLHSFFCTRAFGKGRDIISMDGDNYFNPTILLKLLRDKHKNAMLVDFDAKLDAEATKAQIKNGYVLKVAKKLPEAHAEITGLLKMSKKLAATMYRYAAEAARGKPHHPHLNATMNQIYAKSKVYALAIKGKYWIEIDYLSDLKRAQTIHK